MIVSKWRAWRNTAMYQGWGKKQCHFEQWSYRLNDAASARSFLVTAGIAWDTPNNTAAAFIEIKDNKRPLFYQTFPLEAWQASHKNVEISIGDNFFSLHQIRLALPHISGTVEMQQLSPVAEQLSENRSTLSRLVRPFPYCQEVLSMRHTLQGTLHLDNETINWDGGVGYSDKLWGHTFPPHYLYLQSTQFRYDEEVSFMLAMFPAKENQNELSNFIGVLYHEGDVYSFTPYNDTDIKKATIQGEAAEINFVQKDYLLIVKIQENSSQQQFGQQFEVRFFKGNKMIFCGTGKQAVVQVKGAYRNLSI
ncbi:MAG: hypothetical protein IPL35_01030 [Sphingobacteriales bacterium]|nr:hypothetical protein [Sphingobacteriales bacterium]